MAGAGTVAGDLTAIIPLGVSIAGASALSPSVVNLTVLESGIAGLSDATVALATQLALAALIDGTGSCTRRSGWLLMSRVCCCCGR